MFLTFPKFLGESPLDLLQLPHHILYRGLLSNLSHCNFHLNENIPFRESSGPAVKKLTERPGARQIWRGNKHRGPGRGNASGEDDASYYLMSLFGWRGGVDHVHLARLQILPEELFADTQLARVPHQLMGVAEVVLDEIFQSLISTHTSPAPHHSGRA